MKLSQRIVLLFFFALVACSLIAQGHHAFMLKDTTRNYVRLLFAGDAMQHSPQFRWAWNAEEKRYDYEPNFRYLRSYLADADINIVNLETTLAGKPYSGYPRFRTPDAFFNELVAAGFQVFSLANNHILDADLRGVRRTTQTMSEHPTMGVYSDADERTERYPLILHIDGIKIALFSATYGTNQLVPEWPCVVNYIETEQLEIDMAQSIKDTTIDLRIMYIHWGTEYQLHHNAYQKGVGQWLADLGIDMVIGSHPHVVQDYELLTAADGRCVPVIYSLGNLISNQRWVNSNGGILARVDIDRTTRKIIKVDYVPVYVHKGDLQGEGYNYYCIPTVDYLSGLLPFAMPNDSLENDLRIFHQNTYQRMSGKQ